MNTTHCISTTNPEHQPRICWSAIFAGAFVAVGLGFLLHLFSVAIGLSAYTSTPDGAKVIAIGGVLGLLIGVIVSMGVAGLVAGYLGRFYYCRCHGGVIYGFLAWSLALLLSAIFLMPLAHFTTAYKMNLASAVITKPMMQMAKETKSATPEAKNNSGSENMGKNKTMMQQAFPILNEVAAMAYSSWLVFILFFIGALSSCIGACCGMGCKRELEAHHHPEIR